MRKLIAVAAVMAVTSVHAEELKFGDLNYFLKQGQFNVAADVSSTYYKESIKFEDGSETETNETRGVLFETRYGYGLTDTFNVFLGIDYAYDREVESKSDPSQRDYRLDGFANPAVGANLRLMNQNDAGFNFDLGAVARLSLEKSRGGAPAHDGNFAEGRHSGEINARIGKKWNEANEWQVTVGGIYHLDGETHDFGGLGKREKVEQDSSMDIFVRAAYQYRPVNEFMMSISAQATKVGETESKYKKSEFKIEEDSHFDLDFVFRAKYLITDNFIANFHAGMSRNAEYDGKVDSTDIEFLRRRENFFGLGVEFLF